MVGGGGLAHLSLCCVPPWRLLEGAAGGWLSTGTCTGAGGGSMDSSKASSSSKVEGGKEKSSFLDFFEEGP